METGLALTSQSLFLMDLIISEYVDIAGVVALFLPEFTNSLNWGSTDTDSQETHKPLNTCSLSVSAVCQALVVKE